MQNQLKILKEKALKYALSEGQNETKIRYFEVLKSSSNSPLHYGILNPSFCVVVQGAKKVLIGPEIVNYGPGGYLTSLIDYPMAGQILNASQKSPYLGLKIDYTREEVSSLLADAKLNLKAQTKSATGAFTSQADTKVLETFIKIFELLEAPADIPYLSQLLKKELIYRLLTGESGHLFAQYIPNQNDVGISKAVTWIKKNFDKALTIEQLAKASGMSVSSLHHKFKAYAAMGPLQYQKMLRLQEARRLLMIGEESDTTSVALRIGYESSSQFSREYRRLFGLPPIQDAKNLKKMQSWHRPISIP